MDRLDPQLPPTSELTDLVRAAGDGDQEAWDSIVDRFSGLVWAIARAHRLSAADAADVSQTTWLRLVEHLGRLRDPERIGSWLASTARHECLRVIRHAGRFVESDLDLESLDTEAEPPASLLATERTTALWRAVNGLSDRCRELIRVLMADPPPSYEDVAAALDMPIGSIGPTRARCLEQLRRRPEIAGI